MIVLQAGLHTNITTPLHPHPSHSHPHRYYADAGSNDILVPEDEQPSIAQTARLDLLWPTMYINSNDTKAVYMAMPLSTTNRVTRQ